MLEQNLLQLTQELGISSPGYTAGLYSLELAPNLLLELKDQSSHIHIDAVIGPVPTRQREYLFSYLLKGNFLGQGTGGRIISIDPTEQKILLSHDMEQEISYEAFKLSIEEFTNYLCYWQSEIQRLQKQSLPSSTFE